MAASTKTMRDIVTRAMRRGGILALDQGPEAAEADEILAALNGMIFGWGKKGVIIPSYTAKTLNDLFPLDEAYDDGVTAMLAVRIADENGIALKPATVQAADECWKDLLAEYLDIAETAEFDPVLTNMPSQRLLLGSTA